MGMPFWGKGIAAQALSMLIEDVKTNTDIVRLFATVFEGNENSVKVLKKAGFICEGTHRKAVFKNAVFYDAMMFARVLE